MIEKILTADPTDAPTELQAALLERIEDGQIELPLLPDIAWQVLELSTADNTDAQKLAALIHRDQALAGHLLRIANSPAYRPRMPIVSLQQAVSRLGTALLAAIAFAATLHSRAFEVPGHKDTVQMLWRHAVSTAVYAKEVARMHRSNVEGAFLCGLLHDIGKPIILQTLLNIQHDLGIPLESADVNAMMDAYHTQIGGVVASTWALPPHVSESIALHHDYVATPTCTKAVIVTCLADCLSYHFLFPDTYEVDTVRQHPVLADLNFYPDDVETLLGKREQILQIVEAMS